MLFLIAAKNVCKDKKIKYSIHKHYLINDNVQNNADFKVKLKQVEADWNVYKNLVFGYTLSAEEKNSPLYINYSYFINEIKKIISSGVDITELISMGLNNFSVIKIELEPEKNPWENPQEIFESMNSIGKPLSLADLVRNFLLLGLKPDKQERLYKRYWLQIEKALPRQVSLFIRDYMQGKEKQYFKQASENNYKDLYQEFKMLYKGKDPEHLMKDLSRFATIYSYVSLGKDSGSKAIDGLLSELRRISVSTAYSFLMMLLYAWTRGEFTEGEIIGILEAFNVYCIRRRVIGITAAENKIFPSLIKYIPNLKAAKDKKKEMFAVLSSQENNMRLPNDLEMTRVLWTRDFYNFRNCKYVLALIEEKITKIRPDLTSDKLQVEHIMPQTLSKDWENVLGDYERIHMEYVDTIGNLTLITYNQELGNKSFDEKKKVYENKAGLQIAKTEITNHDKWTESEIKQRRDWIIKCLLDHVVPIPDERRNANNFIMKDKRVKLRHMSFIDMNLIGKDINFISDPSITARVVSDKEVDFEGKRWKLSPLTREIYTRKGTVSKSGAYQGAQHWEYEGTKLIDMM